MECWSVQHRAFAVENDSVVVTQRTFRWHLNIHQNDSVPSRNTVLLWMRNFSKTGSAAKKRKSPGREPSLRTPRTSNDRVKPLSEALRLQECADNKGRHLTDTTLRN
jgi:hypothetical protein